MMCERAGTGRKGGGGISDDKNEVSGGKMRCEGDVTVVLIMVWVCEEILHDERCTEILKGKEGPSYIHTYIHLPLCTFHR